MSQILNTTNSVRRFSTTSSVQSYGNAAGIGMVGQKVYINPDGTAGLWADEVADTAVNLGAKNGATVSVVEKGFGGFLHETTLTLTDLPLTLTDLTAGGGVKIYDFPAGAITILGATGSVAEKTTSVLADTLNASKTYNWGLGTTVQENGELATTEQDILPTTNGTSSATINVAGAASGGVRVGAPASFNGSATPIDVFFNVGLATADDIDADATTVWNGTIKILWTFNGDV